MDQGTRIRLTLLVEAIRGVTDHRLDELRQAADFVESAIADHVSHLGEVLTFADVAEAELEEFQEIVGRIEQVQGTFAQGLRRALFVSIWSALEADLEQLARMIAEVANLRVRPSDLAGKGVQRSVTYLTKVVGLQPPASRVWGQISALNKLRNTVVHGDSKVKDSDKKKLRAIASWKSLAILDDQVELRQKFVPEALEVITEFLNQTFNSLRSLWPVSTDDDQLDRSLSS